MKLKLKTQTLDYTSGLTSSLCAVHCILLPLVVAFLPALGLAWLGSHAFGVGMLAFTILVGTWAIWKGYFEHKKCWPLLWFGVGIIALLVSEFILHDMVVQKEVMLGARKMLVWGKGHPAHHYVSAFGGLIVAGSHFLNHTFCKRCKTCKHHE